jgi:hypothetical protein
MAWKPPFPEGITPAERARLLGQHCRDQLRLIGSLREMAVDWAFCTVGCLYTYGGLDYDVVAEFVATHPDLDCSAMPVTLPRPVFRGIRRPGWRGDEPLDNTLLAVPLEYWDAFRDHVSGVGMVDRRRGRYAQATVQEIEVVDQIALDRAIVLPEVIPTAPVTAFGVDGTHHHIAFVPRTDRPDAAAAVVHLPVRDVTRRVGIAILTGNPAPLREQEGEPLEQCRRGIAMGGDRGG